MKKKGFIGRLAAVAVVLCLITMSLTAGTLAKYASEASGNATATVAKWAIKFTDGGSNTYDDTTDIALTLKDTTLGADLVTDGKIAPGTSGKFQLAVDGTGTEVAFDYTITLAIGKITEGSDTLSTKAPLKFYSKYTAGATDNVELVTSGTGTDEIATLTGTIKAAKDGDAADAQKQTIDVYWVWDSSDITISGVTGEDNIDTKLGIEADTFTIPVAIKAEQRTTPIT